MILRKRLLLKEPYNNETVVIVSNPINKGISVVSLLNTDKGILVKYSMADFLCYRCYIDYELASGKKIPIVVGVIDDPEVKEVEINRHYILEVINGYFIGININVDKSYSLNLIK